MRKISALLLVLTMLLSVCAVTAAADDVVTLYFVERYGNPTRTASLRGLLDEFEAANPDIKVELISPPLEQSQQKITQMLMAKNDLDVLEVTAWERAQYIANGWLADLTEYYADYEEAKTMKTGIYDTLQINGKFYTIPIGSYDRMLYYRVDWMEEAGLEFPEPGPEWTYDALYELAKALTNPEQGRYGWVLRGAGNAYQQFVQQVTLAAVGIENLMSIEEFYFMKDGTSIWATDAAKKGLEFQLKFYKDCAPADSIAWLYSDQVNAFTSGICGLIMQDSDCVGTFKANMKEGSWATYPMPVDAETGQAVVGRGSDGWAMTSYSKHPEEAWRLLAFLGSAEINTRFCKDYGVLPAHTTANEYDAEFESGYYAPYTYMFNQDNYVPVGGVDTPYAAFLTEFGDTSDTDLQNLLLGNTTVEEVQAKWAAEWEEAREDYGGLE